MSFTFFAAACLRPRGAFQWCGRPTEHSLNICVLTYLESENARKRDIVVEHVATALKELGHDVRVLGVHGDAQKLLEGVTNPRPDLVFNLMEMFGKDFFGDVEV